MKINVLSLFDGISCARVSIERAGFEIGSYYASEIDEFAKQVSLKNYPDIVQIGDVKNIDGKLFENIFLLIGGSPCQDLSIAGKRKGLEGQRSGLFYEYVRILKEVKPKYFILENVASMPKKAKDTISEELGVQPLMINASLVSAQNRKRLFWVGKWNGENYEQVEIPQPEDRNILLKDILEDDVDEKYFLNVDRIKYVINRPKNFAVKIDQDKTNTLRTNYGNASANETYVTTKRIGSLNSGGQGDRIYSQEGKSVALSANGGGRGAKTGLYLAGNTNPSDRGQSGNIYSSEGKGQALMAGGGNPNRQRDIGYSFCKILHKEQIRKLTPTECLRLQSMPDNYFDKAEYKGKPISNTQKYKMCGNAFNCEVVKHIISQLYKSFTPF